MKIWYNIWLSLLTIACLVNFWALGNAYERIAQLTLAVENHREVIEAQQEVIELQGEKINEIINYLQNQGG